MNPPSPKTRLSLVVRLHNPQDGAAWTEFVEIYEPLILRLAERYGLQPCDARDVCQQVMEAVAADSQQWKPDGKHASFSSSRPKSRGCSVAWARLTSWRSLGVAAWGSC